MTHKYGLVDPKMMLTSMKKWFNTYTSKGKHVNIHAPTEDISGNASFQQRCQLLVHAEFSPPYNGSPSLESLCVEKRIMTPKGIQSSFWVCGRSVWTMKICQDKDVLRWFVLISTSGLKGQQLMEHRITYVREVGKGVLYLRLKRWLCGMAVEYIFGVFCSEILVQVVLVIAHSSMIRISSPSMVQLRWSTLTIR